tara:strand:- start:452 stop:751 length:300 start_codon:yes stop_codon:yes gene_type:complete
MTKILKKLILVFEAKSLIHLIKIFLIFGLAGSLSLYLSELIYNYINLKDFVNIYIVKLFIKIIFLIIIYQITLLSIAIIFGEFKYFFKFFKKFFNRFKL